MILVHQLLNKNSRQRKIAGKRYFTCIYVRKFYVIRVAGGVLFGFSVGDLTRAVVLYSVRNIVSVFLYLIFSSMLGLCSGFQPGFHAILKSSLPLCHKIIKRHRKLKFLKFCNRMS